MSRKKARAALERAITIAGGQIALAEAIGVRQSLVSSWLNTSKKGVPAERLRDIERVTGVAAQELRPDLFGQPRAVTANGFEDEGAEFNESVASTGRRVDHFSRFKRLRRALFASREEIEQHVGALRDEWDRR